MMKIGSNQDFIAIRRGIVYEGGSYQLWAIYPRPLIVDAEFSPLECPENFYRDKVFMEDSFDTVTRVRRGRFYCMIDGNSPNNWTPDRVENGLYGKHVGIADGQFDCGAIGRPASVSDVESARKEIVCLGSGTEKTYWRVTDVERNIFGHQVFTLRAQSLFGVLPGIMDIVKDKDGNPLERDAIQKVRGTLSKLIDTYHKFQPTSTVDGARESARIILSKWLGPCSVGNDLGELIKTLPEKYKVLSGAAFIVNRLHARTKASEQENQLKKGNNIREPIEEDARTSVELIGMILREIGWDTKR